jgi:hypothetical protein
MLAPPQVYGMSTQEHMLACWLLREDDAVQGKQDNKKQ